MAKERANYGLWDFGRCLVIVAYPGNETVWAGGTIVMNSDSQWTSMCIYQGGENEQTQKFRKAAEKFNAEVVIPHSPITDPDNIKVSELEEKIMTELPHERFDLIITHSLWSENTNEKSTDKIVKALMALRDAGRISTKEIWMFAYRKKQNENFSTPSLDADKVMHLPNWFYQQKKEIITDIYQYPTESIEAKSASKREAFWILQPGARR